MISRRYFLATLLLAATSAHAQLSVEITGAGANRIPLAVANFEGERIVSQALVSVVKRMLAGFF